MNNYHNEIDNANNFLNQIIVKIVEKSKATLNCLQYNNVTIEMPLDPEPPQPTPLFAKSKERRYECPTCKKSYFTSLQLKSHSKVHSNERPFKCDICAMSFKFKVALTAHIKITPKKNKIIQTFFPLKIL